MSILRLITAAGWLEVMTSTPPLSTLVTHLTATRRRGCFVVVVVPIATVVLMTMVATRVVATMMATAYSQGLKEAERYGGCLPCIVRSGASTRGR
jgi:hypothetical protein